MDRLPTFTPDGLPNVRTVGLHRRRVGDLYHAMLMASWPKLMGTLAGIYVVANGIFALAYVAVGHGIKHAHNGSFADAFFFSIQTMATIGYGEMAPRGFVANVLVALEAMVGLVGFAMVTGLTFAKFSRPTARVLFSRSAVISTRDGVRSLMFRMANERGRSAIVEATAHVVLARDEVTAEGESVRRFHELALVRSTNALFALSWTAVHPITETSPLHGATPDVLLEQDATFIVSVTGLDETVGQTVHARHVYAMDEVKWEARFADILARAENGQRLIDYSRFHDTIGV